MEVNEGKEGKIDYSKIGFKAGLEIHQQLDVGGKLFRFNFLISRIR